MNILGLISQLIGIKTLRLTTFFVDFLFFLIFFLVQNIVGKINKEILRIGFRIDPTFWFKKITKKVFTIG